MKFRIRLFILVLFVAALIDGCSGPAKNGTTPVTIAIGQGAAERAASSAPSFNGAALVFATVNITITAPDMDAITQTVRVGPSAALVTETFDVKTGLARVITVQAKSLTGNVISQGSTTVDLDGIPQDVTIPMVTSSSFQFEEATAISRDSSGNVIVVGHTYGNIEGGLNSNQSFTSPDVFVKKFDSEGNPIWAAEFGTPGSDLAYGIATDANGNIIVVGETDGNLNEQPKTGLIDAFAVKLDPDGKILWTKLIGAQGALDFAHSAAVDGSGNVYMTGSTMASSLTNVGQWDIFVTKLDSNGNLLWIQQEGTVYDDEATGIAVDNSGNVFVTGFTYGDLDGNMNTNLALTAGTLSDAFLIKFDTNGLRQWTKEFGSSDGEFQGSAVALDGSGNAYIAGTHLNTTLGISDFFIRKYDTAGNLIWVQQLGSGATDFAQAIAIDNAANMVYITGGTNGNLDGNTNADPTGATDDVFVSKYDLSGSKQATWQIGSRFDDQGNGIVVDSGGNILVTGATDGGFSTELSTMAFLVRFSASGVLQ